MRKQSKCDFIEKLLQICSKKRLNRDRGYVLHSLHMSNRDPVDSFKSRGVYGTHFLISDSELQKNQKIRKIAKELFDRWI